MANNNDWIKDYLDKMDGKLDTQSERLNSIDITLAKQSVILEDHTRRSLANEEAVELLKNEIKPIQKERYMVKGALKLGGVLIGSISVIGGIGKVLYYFLH